MLSNAAAKAAGARPRAYKLADGQGLFLHIAPSGTKAWRMKARQPGRETTLTIGRFPDMPVEQARAARDRAKAALAEGRDPASIIRDGVIDDGPRTFAQLARLWFDHNAASWSATHGADVLASMERDVFPSIGDRPAASVQATDLLSLMRAVEDRGCVETARRLRQRLSAVFGFGMALELVTSDPAAQLGRAMKKARPARPHPALTHIEDCLTLVAACDRLDVPISLRLASRFLALTAVRLEAVRGARWDEFERLDRPAPIWRVPAARMKLAQAKKGDSRFDHLVPLCPAALSVLAAAREQSGGEGLVFPGRGAKRCFGENALRDLYARAGFARRHVPHGWRASFSTILNEDMGPDWRTDIDRALAHSPKDKVEAAYNRAALLDRRRAVFERWGELLFPPVDLAA